jgi:hypothetical protein
MSHSRESLWSDCEDIKLFIYMDKKYSVLVKRALFLLYSKNIDLTLFLYFHFMVTKSIITP